MVTIRTERFSDAAGRETLLDAAYGPARFTKTSERLREGRLPAEQLAFVAVHQGASRRNRAACGTCRPAPSGRRCCSARSRCIRTFAIAGSVRCWCDTQSARRSGLVTAPSCWLATPPTTRASALRPT